MSQNINISDHFGTIVKTIRENRDILQSTVAGHDINIRTYRRIEANEVTVSFPQFLIIVNNLNLDVEEFMLIANNYELTDRQEILRLFKELGSTLNVDGIKEFHEHCRTYLQNHDAPEIEDLEKSVDAMYKFSLTNDRKVCQKDIQPLWKKLRNQTTLYYFEALSLLSILFFIDDSSEIHRQIKKLEEVFQLYFPYYETKRHILRAYYNAAYGLDMNNDFLESEPYIDKALKLSKELEDDVVYYDTLFVKAKLEYIKGHHPIGERLANESFEGLRKMENKKNAVNIRNDNMSDWRILTQKKS
ncbi:MULTISPECIES: helix-turn-helix transcriptional regulator [Listeria]|uniref:helix-turn-helix transcriptional regulator n=1 Tax=Listeria TaxID=1637 RepID=UPI000B594BD6|nr:MULTISPECIES: helix-turn-helix transcriptional regulator [Listeria]